MRKTGAIYGGELSAHHYFRDFSFCDSGMIPWLMVWELLSEQNTTLAHLVEKRQSLFISSEEINFTVSDADSTLGVVKSHYSKLAISMDEFDGLSLSFVKWRFNLRKSNTEPLVRLNVETKGDKNLLAQKTWEIARLIDEN